MMLRSVIGSLAAVGVIGGLAAALPERGAAPPQPKPSFGALPKQFSVGAASQPDAEQQSLIKLAAYPTSREASPAPTSPSSPATPADPKRSIAPVAEPALSTSPIAVAIPQTQPAVPARAAEAPALVPPAQEVAALPPPSAPAQQPTTSPSRVNINRASVAELDQLPGAGRIGWAVARRRPYRTVDDLVRKRVLRASTFARIRSAITVD